MSARICELEEEREQLKSEVEQTKHQSLNIPLAQMKDQSSYAVF